MYVGSERSMHHAQGRCASKRFFFERDTGDISSRGSPHTHQFVYKGDYAAGAAERFWLA